MIHRTMVGSQLNVIVKQHTPPPEVKLFPELGIQCDTITSERYGWVPMKTGEGGGGSYGNVTLKPTSFYGKWAFCLKNSCTKMASKSHHLI